MGVSPYTHPPRTGESFFLKVYADQHLIPPEPSALQGIFKYKNMQLSDRISFSFCLLTTTPREGFYMLSCLRVSRVKVLRLASSHPICDGSNMYIFCPHVLTFPIFTLDYIACNARLNVANYYTSSLAAFGVRMFLCPVWRWLLHTLRNSFINS